MGARQGALSLQGRQAAAGAEEKRFDEGARAARAGLRTDPRNAGHWHMLGMCLGELGRADEELDVHRRAVALSPGTDAYRHDLLVAVINHGGYRKAVTLIDRALARRQELLRAPSVSVRRRPAARRTR